MTNKESSPVSELVDALSEWAKPDTGSRDAGVQLVCAQAADRLTVLEAENARLRSAIEAMEYSDGDASFWRHIAEKNLAALEATLSSDAVAGGEEVDDEKPRYTTKRLRREIERARENDARELDQLRDRVKELEKALEWLIEAADSASWAANIGTMDNAIEAARRVREGGNG